MARPDHVCLSLSKRWRQARAVPLRSAREQCAMVVFEPAPTVATRFVISKERKKGRKKLGVKNPMHRLWRRVTTRGIVRGGWTRNGRRSMEFVSSTCCGHTMKYRSEDIESEMLLKHVVASCYVPMQTIPVFVIAHSVILWKLGWKYLSDFSISREILRNYVWIQKIQKARGNQNITEHCNAKIIVQN